MCRASHPSMYVRRHRHRHSPRSLLLLLPPPLSLSPLPVARRATLYLPSDPPHTTLHIARVATTSRCRVAISFSHGVREGVFPPPSLLRLFPDFPASSYRGPSHQPTAMPALSIAHALRMQGQNPRSSRRVCFPPAARPPCSVQWCSPRPWCPGPTRSRPCAS